MTLGKKEIHLKENENIYIPKETKHRIENPGKLPLEFIEIQTGDYLEEDDIERFDDIYGRVK
jgi:mannose-6-phosphate isomerase-like protein (cupin superfamily)